MTMIYTAEIEAYDPDTSGVVTYRYATHTYIDGSTIYEPRMEKAPRYARSMRTSLVGGTSTELSFGEIRLLNGDGGLDAMRADYFDGRKVTIKYGDSASAYGTFATVLIARIAGIAYEGDAISIRLRDRLPELDKVFSTAVYGGTNVLPNGLDGRPDDIKGQYRPRPLGIVSLMAPVMVNTSLLIYEISCKQCDYIGNVFDAGSYLSRGSDYSSSSDMQTNQPASGTFRVLYTSTGTYFRLGSTAYGQVTAMVFEKWAHTSVSAAGILSRIFGELGWSAGTDYVAGDLTKLDENCAGPLGLLVQQEETIASLIDRIAGTVGAWWGYDLQDRLIIKRLEFGTSVATLTSVNLKDLEGQSPDDPPIWRTVVPGDWNYAPQEKSSLAGIVQLNAARTAWLGLESRNQQAQLTSVKTSRLTATEQRYDGAFHAISQAQAESTRRLNLFRARRDLNTCQLQDYASYSGVIDLGATVTLSTSELGYSSGRDMIVIGIDVDLDADTADLTLWG